MSLKGFLPGNLLEKSAVLSKVIFIFSIQSLFVHLPGENDKKAVPFCLHAQFLLLLLLTTLISFRSFSQCPPNIDFEMGTFENWTCYTGNVSAAGGVNTIFLSSSGAPVPNHHTMYTAPTSEVDYFGGFPV